MSKQFTWWRRFFSNPKLEKKHLYKGASELLQRIEFGEFEYDKLGREVYLEDKIYEFEKQKIIKQRPWLNKDTLPDALEHINQQWRKRTHIIWDTHLKNERKKINSLIAMLAKEFKLSTSFVENLIEEFTGTTRELYYKCMSIATGKQINPDNMQRMCIAPPMHFLKKDQKKYKQLWSELVKENGWQVYTEWHHV